MGLLECSCCDRAYAECAYAICGSVTMSKCHRWRIEVRVTRVTINVMSWKYELVRRRKPKIDIQGAPKVGSSKVRLLLIKKLEPEARGKWIQTTGCAPCCMLCVWCPLQHCAWCCLWCFVVPPVRLVTGWKQTRIEQFFGTKKRCWGAKEPNSQSSCAQI